MATRPWVTPEEVRAYSEIKSVQERSDERLAVDISRAEQYVITYTHNKFTDELPAPVKTAVILLAEAYASYAHQMKTTSGGAFKSETFDDYSYSVGDATLSEMISALDLPSLLDEYVITGATASVTMRMRRL